MLNLIKKEIALCMHPTAFIFLFFAVLVFMPNYPYEVIFFFSCLSVVQIEGGVFLLYDDKGKR